MAWQGLYVSYVGIRACEVVLHKHCFFCKRRVIFYASGKQSLVDAGGAVMFYEHCLFVPTSVCWHTY